MTNAVTLWSLFLLVAGVAMSLIAPRHAPINQSC
jgi:hypothetical protein